VGTAGFGGFLFGLGVVFLFRFFFFFGLWVFFFFLFGFGVWFFLWGGGPRTGSPREPVSSSSLSLEDRPSRVSGGGDVVEFVCRPLRRD